MYYTIHRYTTCGWSENRRDIWSFAQRFDRFIFNGLKSLLLMVGHFSLTFLLLLLNWIPRCFVLVLITYLFVHYGFFERMFSSRRLMSFSLFSHPSNVFLKSDPHVSLGLTYITLFTIFAFNLVISDFSATF